MTYPKSLKYILYMFFFILLSLSVSANHNSILNQTVILTDGFNDNNFNTSKWFFNHSRPNVTDWVFGRRNIDFQFNTSFGNYINNFTVGGNISANFQFAVGEASPNAATVLMGIFKRNITYSPAPFGNGQALCVVEPTGLGAVNGNLYVNNGSVLFNMWSNVTNQSFIRLFINGVNNTCEVYVRNNTAQSFVRVASAFFDPVNNSDSHIFGYVTTGINSVPSAIRYVNVTNLTQVNTVGGVNFSGLVQEAVTYSYTLNLTGNFTQTLIVWNGTTTNITSSRTEVNGASTMFTANITSNLVLNNRTYVEFYFNYSDSSNVFVQTNDLMQNVLFSAAPTGLVLTSNVTQASVQLYNGSYFNVTQNANIRSAGFRINGSDYDANISLFTTPSFRLTILVPEIGGTTQTVNVSSILNVTYNNQSLIRLFTLPQTINRIDFSQCNGTFTNLTTTIWVRNEETFINQSANVQLTFYTFPHNISNRVNFSFNLSASHEYRFCMGDTNLTTDTIISFSNSSGGFDTRSFYMIRTPLNRSNPVMVNLFMSNRSVTSLVTYTITDENDNPLFGRNYPDDGIFLLLQRFDPSTNTYNTVEVSKTDSNGQAINHVVLNDVFYRIIIQNITNTLFRSASDKISLTSLFFQITIGRDFLQEIIDQHNIDYILTYSNTSGDNKISLFYNDISAVGSSGCLDVIRKSSLRDEKVCDQCLASTSGTIECTVGGGADGVYSATGYTISSSSGRRVNFVSNTYNLYNPQGRLGLLGAFFSIIIIGFCGMLGIWKPGVALMMTLLAVILVSWGGFLSFTYGMVVAVAILFITMVIKMKS